MNFLKMACAIKNARRFKAATGAFTIKRVTMNDVFEHEAVVVFSFLLDVRSLLFNKVVVVETSGELVDAGCVVVCVDAMLTLADAVVVVWPAIVVVLAVESEPEDELETIPEAVVVVVESAGVWPAIVVVLAVESELGAIPEAVVVVVESPGGAVVVDPAGV